MRPALDSLLSDLVEVLSELKGLAREISDQVDSNAARERDEEDDERCLLEEVSRLLDGADQH